jgi:hypothetical protein
MDADGCSKRRLTPDDPDNEHPEQSPNWSPEGDRIAYSKSSDSSSAIYTMKPDGSGTTLVAKVPAYSQAGLALDWLDTTSGQDANVDQETAEPGVKAECSQETGDDQQGIQVPTEDVTPEAYMDQINKLLREDDLRGSEPGSEVRGLARTKTLTTLEESDPDDRAKILRFLAGTGLVQRVGAQAPIISLGQADLEDAGLREVHLAGANLGGADLDGVDMSGGDLSGAYAWEIQLRNSDLRDADLAGGNLTGAELKDADLRGADLRNAKLFGADLTGADLTGAVLTGTDLRETVMSGTEITLPDEHTAQMAVWEAAARGQLRELTATVKSCLETYRPTKWDPDVSSQALLDARVLHCTTTFGVYGDSLRPNVSYRMVPQTHLVDGAKYNTGEVTIQSAHSFGGSAYESSTANSGRIDRIPRWF